MPSINDSKCVSVTGATSGIGHSLAIALAALPSQPKVIAAGRRQRKLDEFAKSNLQTVQVDLDADAEGLKAFVDNVLQQHPNALVSLVESELHDGKSSDHNNAYGTTEKLSKFWMSLEEYTKVTLEALKNGETCVTTESASDALKGFNTGNLN
ncbi:hypothetical protein C0995_012696 [Termitomyces sp. Mi166|nr:hypothetical protein C0995_012696 [Termitomyces sp. Mi166\